MAKLSDVDLSKKLGRDIYISNFKQDTVKSAGIGVTIGMAWALDKERKVTDRIICELDHRGEVVHNEKTKLEMSVPANGSAIIVTDESIYLNNTITGTCHSRVSLVAAGWGHIGTMIMPESVGPLVITIHNNTQNLIPMKHREEIAVIMFDELASEATHSPVVLRREVNNRTALLENAGVTLLPDENRAITVSVARGVDDVLSEMKDNEHYKAFKNKYKKWKITGVDIALGIAGLFTLCLLVASGLTMICNFTNQATLTMLQVSVPITFSFFMLFLGMKFKNKWEWIK